METGRKAGRWRFRLGAGLATWQEVGPGMWGADQPQRDTNSGECSGNSPVYRVVVVHASSPDGHDFGLQTYEECPDLPTQTQSARGSSGAANHATGTASSVARRQALAALGSTARIRMRAKNAANLAARGRCQYMTDYNGNVATASEKENAPENSAGQVKTTRVVPKPVPPNVKLDPKEARGGSAARRTLAPMATAVACFAGRSATSARF